jgi:predicted  nucleic acid-binding Zn-ribbon protein
MNPTIAMFCIVIAALLSLLISARARFNRTERTLSKIMEGQTQMSDSFTKLSSDLEKLDKSLEQSEERVIKAICRLPNSPSRHELVSRIDSGTDWKEQQ